MLTPMLCQVYNKKVELRNLLINTVKLLTFVEVEVLLNALYLLRRFATFENCFY